MANTSRERVVVVDGVRTAFAKLHTGLAGYSSLELGVSVVDELLRRTELAAHRVQRVVFGEVIPSFVTPNMAREIVLHSQLPATTDGHSVSRACTTSYQAIADTARAIALGEISIGIAGGTDSASQAPLGMSLKLGQALWKLQRTKSLRRRLTTLARLRPADLSPQVPSLEERTTGLTMGESAERMAQENSISRHDQDQFAFASQRKARDAWDDGRYLAHVLPLETSTGSVFAQDNLVRRAPDLAALRSLTPTLSAQGTLTAGNSSALTDGAAALLLTSESAAEELGLEPLGYLRSFEFTALDPRGQSLLGPAYAIPRLLDRERLTLDDIDLFDIHEAFAAQVLSVVQKLSSDDFAHKELQRSRAIGQIEPDRLNVMGGSIALGHPFAATGARQVIHGLAELKRTEGRRLLCSACAAGGLGAAQLFERI